MAQSVLTDSEYDVTTTFNILKYSDEALSAINLMRLDGSLCDVTLRVKGVAIRAHKVVLAACSIYFRTMFTTAMREATCSEVELREPSMSSENVQAIVDFAYTHEIRVNQHNVQSLLTLGMFLEIAHVIEVCTLYMEHQLHPGNCIGFFQFAAFHGCQELKAKAIKYTQENFCEVIKYNEFLGMDSELMINILQQDELNVRCESEVFQAVVRWVEHDAMNRMDQLLYLLEKVRLTSLAPCFLENQLEKCVILKKLPKCMQLLLDRLCTLHQHKACPDTPRKPCKPMVIYTVGGFHRKFLESWKCFECYNPQTRIWTRLPDLPRARCGAGVASLKGRIYVLGGRIMQGGGEYEDTNALDVYDPENNMWSTKTPMGAARNRVGVGVLDNKVYAVGGASGHEHHNIVERYNPEWDRWEKVANLRTSRMSTGVAVLNRLMYAIGGFDGRERLKSVECYHPETDEWWEMESMLQARSGAGVSVLGEHIIAVGGYDGQRQLASVERFDLRTRKWENVAPLKTARSGVGVAVVDNKLFALGGYDGENFLACVESYNPETDQWQCEGEMICERSGHSVTVDKEPTLR